MTTRRSFLALLGTLTLGADRFTVNAGAASRPDTSPRVDGDELDEALEILAPFAPSYRGGLSNHGPMTVEALVALGHEDQVLGWVERYRGRLEARPASSERIETSQWRAALGEKSRIRDWEEWFSNELAESSWRDVVGLWVPRLAPGMAAAGMHGVIRVGHAVTSLGAKESALRLDELARALGYWAAEFMTLPGEPAGGGKLAPSAALGQIALLPDEHRRSRGLITTQLAELRGFEPFVKAIDLVDPASGAPNFLSELIATFAGVFVNTKSSSFDFLHAVTGAAAVAELLPHVEPAERERVQVYSWQMSAGIFARYARQGLTADVDLESEPESLERLAELAVASGDAHTIKLVAACSREWSRNPEPRLLAAAASRVHAG